MPDTSSTFLCFSVAPRMDEDGSINGIGLVIYDRDYHPGSFDPLTSPDFLSKILQFFMKHPTGLGLYMTEEESIKIVGKENLEVFSLLLKFLRYSGREFTLLYDEIRYDSQFGNAVCLSTS